MAPPEPTRWPLSGWQLLSCAPGHIGAPDQLPQEGWLDAQVPGTAASALRALRRFDFDTPRDFDAEDFWYRTHFTRPRRAAGQRVMLHFGGLATLVDVYLNGACVLRSDSMFVAHALDVTEQLADDNQLQLHFRALKPALAAKMGRPRYRTKLVEQQQLRWVRTTLLGRTPGFCPPVAPVGPYRPIEIELVERAQVVAQRLRTRVEADTGVLSLELTLAVTPGTQLRAARCRAFGGEHQLTLSSIAQGLSVRGEARLADAPRWWPHTHGAQPLFDVELLLEFTDGGRTLQPLGRVGFRTLTLDTRDDGFRLLVNGQPIFCRGACWTPSDVVALDAAPEAYRTALTLAQRAGMNMIRVGGTMLYEADAFHALCDELGILLWQDFMFANMDYPVDDSAFSASVREEATQLCQRLARHVSSAIVCGNSEVEQQAAMLGLPRTAWTTSLFTQLLPEVLEAESPGLPYWPSSPSGGVMPFAVSQGATHYYGVGAYLRPLEDARRSGVRFASECLAFANVPEDVTLDKLAADLVAPAHTPRWKERVPRDRGASWDFDDVRDHYTELLFGVRPSSVRYGDPERFLELARVTSGEVMARTFAEWRRPGSSCNGGLIWWYRDLWPGAGWGVLDSSTLPKAAYWYLKRVLAPRTLVLSDEGLDGLFLHALNERPEPADVTLRVALYRAGEVLVAEKTQVLSLPARGAESVRAQTLFEGFVDLTYAYRFGPPAQDLVVASMRESDGTTHQAFYFPLGLPAQRELDVGLAAVATPLGEGRFALSVSTRRFAQSVALLLCDGAEPDDNYFHIEPGESRRILVRTTAEKLTGDVRALNANGVARIRMA
jgi:beta-mannosidase